MKKRIILAVLIVVSSCKDKNGNSKFSFEPAKTPETKELQELEKQCVFPKKGLRLRKSPSLDSETIEILPYQTTLTIYEFGKSQIIENRNAKWARVKFKDNFGWVFSGFLNWDCDEYEKPENIRIDSQKIIGRYVKPDSEDRYFIEFFENNTFEMSIFGGCDGDGCISHSDFGEWKVFNNLIYMKTKSRTGFYNDVIIYYMSNDYTLYPIDSDHAFKENYSNDTAYGFKKQKSF